MKRTPLLNLIGMFLLLTFFVINMPTLASQNSQNTKPPNTHDAKVIAAIRQVLDTQVAAWNRGDLEGFMQGYWQSEATTFISGDTVTYGWQTVLDRYKKGYPTREKMGTLRFSDLEIKVFNKDTAVAHGSWELTRATDKPHGRFTLIFRRTPQGWRIVHDHTSS
ncbi:MAG: hypothetical protein QOJ64_2670 [Acidobacteriota bacterium]|jgi:uncharacterized protein (TIGR02246 family)|nr:hypothetical protein [Acidobacteriota bacterium]